MRVLVTGGAGFVGSAIVDQLVARGHDIVVIDNLLEAAHAAEPTYLNSAATYMWADLRDADVARRAITGIDAVCHQASMVGLGVDFADAPGYVGHNDLATAQLLAAMHERRFTGRLVLASSMVVYGEGAYRCDQHGMVRPGPRDPTDVRAGRFEPTCPACGRPLTPELVDEGAPLDPRNVYAATKLHQEHLCSAYASEHQTSFVALRYHNVYGPRMPRNTPYAGVASIFRSAAERAEPPKVFEDGNQRRDFVHVDDVARANVLALENDDATGAFNVASGEPHTVLEMAVALTRAIDPSAAITPQVVGGHRPGDVRHVTASPERARACLGFEAAVSFAEGMTRFATDPLRG
jgi:dTDP-L-rhamnose 4-epimerase